MKEWSYTTGLLIGAGLLLVVGLVLTVVELQEYNTGARAQAAPVPTPPAEPAEPATGGVTGAPETGTPAAPSVDASDVKSVATAFVKALAAKNLEEAGKYVPEEKRAASLEKMALREPPAIAGEPELSIEGEGDTVRAAVTNAEGLQFEMIRRDGKWWVNME